MFTIKLGNLTILQITIATMTLKDVF